MTVRIEARRIARQYDRGKSSATQAVRGLSFDCAPGDFLCVLGPTGCGKTTLLRLLAGLDQPDDGSVLVQGEALASVNPHAGMVFQQSALFPWMRAVENVVFPLRMRGFQREKRNHAARDWLARLGLSGFERYYPHQLSGGMAQRVALARALIAEPGVLLMDEPFSAVDERTRHSLQDLLLDLWRETRATVVFVTHNIEEALYLGQRLLLMGSAPEHFSEEIELDLPHPRNRLEKQFTDKLLEVRGRFEKLLA